MRGNFRFSRNVLGKIGTSKNNDLPTLGKHGGGAGGVEEMEEVMVRKGADELARTLEWCADRGRIEGLHPAEVRKAADLLREQAMKNEELSAILAANTPTVLFDERDGLAPYIKERRFTFIAVKPQAYQVEVEARRAVSMFARQFEEAMMEQAMRAIAQTQDDRHND